MPSAKAEEQHDDDSVQRVTMIDDIGARADEDSGRREWTGVKKHPGLQLGMWRRKASPITDHRSHEVCWSWWRLLWVGW
jgi:hypothetical protein